MRGRIETLTPDDAKSSLAGTRTLVSCVKGKYDNHLHHEGRRCSRKFIQICPQITTVIVHFSGIGKRGLRVGTNRVPICVYLKYDNITLDTGIYANAD